MVTQLLFRIVEQHQGVYEQNSIEKIARFCKTDPTKSEVHYGLCSKCPVLFLQLRYFELAQDTKNNPQVNTMEAVSSGQHKIIRQEHTAT